MHACFAAASCDAQNPKHPLAAQHVQDHLRCTGSGPSPRLRDADAGFWGLFSPEPQMLGHTESNRLSGFAASPFCTEDTEVAQRVGNGAVFFNLGSEA